MNLTWSVSPGNDYDNIVRFEIKFYSNYYLPKFPYKSVASITKQVRLLQLFILYTIYYAFVRMKYIYTQLLIKIGDHL